MTKKPVKSERALLNHELPPALPECRAACIGPDPRVEAGNPIEGGETPISPLESRLKIERNGVWGCEARKLTPEVRARIRGCAALSAQFANELLTANYLLFKHTKEEPDSALVDALRREATEADGRYKAWGTRLSSYVRDAIQRRVAGIIKARGREVLIGKCSLPTMTQRGAILVRERGVTLWREEGKLLSSMKVEPDAAPIEFALWMKNVDGPYRAVLERLLDGTYVITQGQILLNDWKVSVRFSYRAEIDGRQGLQGVILRGGDSGLCLQVGARVIEFGYDVAQANSIKHQINARRVQCWRLLRGRRLKLRRARIYRSGTLSGLSRKWQDFQKTWAQQLGAAIVAAAIKAGCGELHVPSTGMLAAWFPAGENEVGALDWTAVVGAIANAAAKAGLLTSQIATELEQKRDLRKSATKAKKEALRAQRDAEKEQPGG